MQYGILHRCRWLLSPVTTIAITAALAFAAALHAAPAQALNNRSFVSATGNDANPCTRPLPCRKVAHDNTNPAGEINTLDPAGYGVIKIAFGIMPWTPLTPSTTWVM